MTNVGRTFCVYILASEVRKLYVGITNNIYRRVAEHKAMLRPGYTSEHNITRLVHVEYFNNALTSIWRERQIKGWSRAKKVSLIESENPAWADLSSEWVLKFARGAKRPEA